MWCECWLSPFVGAGALSMGPFSLCLNIGSARNKMKRGHCHLTGGSASGRSSILIYKRRTDSVRGMPMVALTQTIPTNAKPGNELRS
jgi:hypothetical protein